MVKHGFQKSKIVKIVFVKPLLHLDKKEYFVRKDYIQPLKGVVIHIGVTSKVVKIMFVRETLSVTIFGLDNDRCLCNNTFLVLPLFPVSGAF